MDISPLCASNLAWSNLTGAHASKKRACKTLRRFSVCIFLSSAAHTLCYVIKCVTPRFYDNIWDGSLNFSSPSFFDSRPLRSTRNQIVFNSWERRLNGWDRKNLWTYFLPRVLTLIFYGSTVCRVLITSKDRLQPRQLQVFSFFWNIEQWKFVLNWYFTNLENKM